MIEPVAAPLLETGESVTAMTASASALDTLRYRYAVEPADRERVRALVAATGYFTPAEVEVAVELVDERLAKGPASGYYFVFAELADQVAGYAAYGPIACTESSYDLYWIAVHPDYQRLGLGRRLVVESERLIAAAGGTRVYIETSGKPQYESTRQFYRRCGYDLEATIAHFYAPNDAKEIYVKPLPPADSSE